MNETAVRPSEESVEENLRADLARGRAATDTLHPVLRHLLSSQNSALFGDEVIARVRGMLGSLAHKLLAAAGIAPQHGETDALALALSRHSDVLAHLHALALEWQLAERLEQRFAIDPVVSPLLQAMIASPEAETQDLAMRLLAAQARWCQGQRRMQLAPAELPGELLHAALSCLSAVASHAGDDAEPHISASLGEDESRLALLARLVTSMGPAAGVALDMRHAGSALFATALALGSGDTREQVLLGAHDESLVRLAVALRSAGQSASAIGQQLLVLHDDAALPLGFDRLSVERARAILVGTRDASR